MVSVKAEESDRFYEEDEDPKEVFAAFEAAQKGRTAPPRDWGAPSTWSARLRFEIAAVPAAAGEGHRAIARQDPLTRVRNGRPAGVSPVRSGSRS
jgi:hypothetical protein